MGGWALTKLDVVGRTCENAGLFVKQASLYCDLECRNEQEQYLRRVCISRQKTGDSSNANCPGDGARIARTCSYGRKPNLQSNVRITRRYGWTCFKLYYYGIPYA